MKRFIDLRAAKPVPNFAFYCTIMDRFEEFNGNQSWNSIEDFEIDFEADGTTSKLAPLERYLSLIQEWVPKKDWGTL